MAADRPARSWAPILFAGAIAVAVLSTGGAALAASDSTAPQPRVLIAARATALPARAAANEQPATTDAPAGAASVVMRAEGTAVPLSGGGAHPSATRKTENRGAAVSPADAALKEHAAATATPPATAVPIVPGAAPARVQMSEPEPTTVVAASSATRVLEREHKVQPGETLSAIAARYGVRTETLVRNNAGVTDRDMLKIGQTLRIPPSDGLLYEVRLGDSLIAIAARYDVEVADVLAEPANNLSAPDMLREGQVVFLPGAKMPPPPPTPTPVPPTPTRTATATATPPARATTGAVIATAVTRAATTIATSASGWRWPISGPISSYFGPSHPLGIDIDLYARDGAPVVASRAGVVTFAGGNPCCSYGYYVELDHGDGTTSLYAHFKSPPPVRIGQRVAQGETVGYAGSTGYSTGTHLHFEIRRGGAPLNPLSYLP